MTAEGKRTCVIGAGFGGLALAIRLQAAGVATTLIEARDKPGGRAYYWYNFFAVPTSPPPPAGGPYRVLRNPMYTVGYLPSYGLALATASLPGLVAAAFDHAAILAFFYMVEQPHFAGLTRCRTEPYD